MPDNGAGASGDPHITRLDGQTFDFDGTPHVPYTFLESGDLAVAGALAPAGGKTYIHRFEIALPAGSKVVIDEKGLTRIDAAGYRLDVWRDQPAEGPLAGVAHLNLYAVEAPADHAAATGLLATGTAAADPATFLARPAP